MLIDVTSYNSERRALRGAFFIGMAKVEDNTKKIVEFYKKQGIETELEMNPGGHFDDHAERLAKGIAYLLKDSKQIQKQYPL